MIFMLKHRLTTLVLTVLAVMFFVVITAGAEASGKFAGEEPHNAYTIDGVEIPVDIAVNGDIIKTPVKGFLADDTTYVPVRAISEALGAVVTWNDAEKKATVVKGETSLCFATKAAIEAGNFGSDVIPAMIYQSTTFVPVRVLAESLGFDVSWDDYYYQVNITLAGYALPQEYVDPGYTDAEILLIAQVLTCECGSADFCSRVAVANVITNRVESTLFPDNVKDVIYDRRGGAVQFTIAYDGKLNNTPQGMSILAAKCALNGVNVVPGALFFQASYVKDSWVTRNRTYSATFCGNDFYL